MSAILQLRPTSTSDSSSLSGIEFNEPLDGKFRRDFRDPLLVRAMSLGVVPIIRSKLCGEELGLICSADEETFSGSVVLSGTSKIVRRIIIYLAIA
jgi:hypothetical protein